MSGLFPLINPNNGKPSILYVIFIYDGKKELWKSYGYVYFIGKLEALLRVLTLSFQQIYEFYCDRSDLFCFFFFNELTLYYLKKMKVPYRVLYSLFFFVERTTEILEFLKAEVKFCIHFLDAFVSFKSYRALELDNWVLLLLLL